MPARPTVRLFHWKASEAGPLIEALRSGGYTVEYPGDKANGNFRSMRENPPHAAVIDLTRLPSHARYVAAAIRQSKSTRGIPIVFVDGEPEKVAKIREELPDAKYTTRERLPSVLKRARPVENPVVPKPMMEQFAARTAAQKLGLKENMRVALLDAPADCARALGKLPPGVSLEEDPDEVLPMTLWFVHDPDAYLAGLARWRRLAGSTRLWILWRKQGTRAKGSGITQFFIREAALAVGLVDYKICSVNEAWSGMLFTRKR
jgi:hypothetical protein